MTRFRTSIVVLVAVVTPLLGAQEPMLPSDGALGLSPLALEDAVPAETLDRLRMSGLEPESDLAYEIAGAEKITVAVFRAADDVRLFLYHATATNTDIFLSVARDDSGQPELRLWNGGPSEIVINAAGAQLVTRQDALSVVDTIACIARSLGIELTRSSLEDGLAQYVCTATSSIALVLTATNCLSMASIGSANIFATIGCINGIAKLISCGMADCSAACVLPPVPLR